MKHKETLKLGISYYFEYICRYIQCIIIPNMEVTVKKWGNSLGIRIPYLIAKNMALKDGIPVRVRNTKAGILISPKQSETLFEMLDRITPQNRHQEVETGNAMGGEVW
jgi:antitoxin MazE